MSMVIGYHDDHDHEDVDNHNNHDLSGRSSHLVHPVSSLFPRGQVPRHKTVAVTADDGDDDDDGVDDDDDDDDNDDEDDDDDIKRLHVFNINLLKVEKLQRPSAYPLEHSQNLGVAVSGKL